MGNKSVSVPKFELKAFRPKRTNYCICIPVFNEGQRIVKQLTKMNELKIHELADIIIVDGDSKDGVLTEEFLVSVKVRAILIKKDVGKLGAQLRMGFHYAINEGYEGVVTVDGNGKDSVESIPQFLSELTNGYDFIQGSRYVVGGKEVNTPLLRKLAIHFVHAPVISALSGFHYTDTTNGFRGHSKKLLTDPRLGLFRDIFDTYQLLFYVSIWSPRLGLKVKEIPVMRAYPAKGKTPTKISFLGNFKIIWTLVELAMGKYDQE